MRAFVIEEPGGPEKLVLRELETPRPGAGEVLLRVRAVGVCHRDIIDRKGKYPFMKRPVVTGHEVAGEVAELGAGVIELAVGDRVVTMHRPPCGACPECREGEETRCTGSPYAYGITADGGYADYMVAHAAALVRLPAEIPFDEGAFLHCTAGVALRALRHQGRLVAGETVLVTGASGGVGIHAVQVAKILGARVIAATGNAAKTEALRAAGADEVVVAEPPALQRAVLACAGRGVDLALELVGAPTWNAALRSLRPGGRLVLVGNVTASRVELNPGWMIMREATVLGAASASRRDLAEVMGWVASGRLRPVVAERMPLEEAPRAQARLAAREVVGRIVLVA